MDAGHVLTTFYACLAVIQSTEAILPHCLVLSRGMSAAATLKSMLVMMEHGNQKIMGTTKPGPMTGDIEVNEVSTGPPSRHVCIC
jgi:ATP-binding cassette, subfamily B (MDR/TAP), member 1